MSAVAETLAVANRKGGVAKTTTVVTPRQALRAAVPSRHQLLVKRDHPSWLRCPACGRWTWARVGLRW
jgi:hypothetical protein